MLYVLFLTVMMGGQPAKMTVDYGLTNSACIAEMHSAKMRTVAAQMHANPRTAFTCEQATNFKKPSADHA